MSSEASGRVRDAVILAAGNGDRFRDDGHRSKLLHPILGRPLIVRTVATVAAAGFDRVHVVLGFEGERVQKTIEHEAPSGVSIDFVVNPEWHLENGVSALLARRLCDVGRFALVMGDHLFESEALRHLSASRASEGESLLAVDTGPLPPGVTEEATRVRLDGDRIVAIGKGLDPWHAIDTGLFIFTPELFDGLEEARRHGETTLSAGVQWLARHGRMRAVPIGGRTWYDVDTVDDLAAAESLFASGQPELA